MLRVKRMRLDLDKVFILTLCVNLCQLKIQITFFNIRKLFAST